MSIGVALRMDPIQELHCRYEYAVAHDTGSARLHSSVAQSQSQSRAR